MRIQEWIFVYVAVFMIVGTIQAEVREKWRARKRKNSAR